MKTLSKLITVVSVALATLSTVPVLAATNDDTQAPRGLTTSVHATNDDAQAPRGQDTQAPATNDDVQAPRG